MGRCQGVSIIIVKICTRCQLLKPLDEFHAAPGRPQGKHSHCKICRNKTINKYQKARYSKDPSFKDKAKANVKKCQSTHEYKEHRNLMARLRSQTDTDFCLRKRLRSRLWDALQGNIKSGKTFELLGCSFKNFKLYLESKFLPGMSWDNYGDWHIDHIKPCASYDLSLPEQQTRCFHYLNLQPLWAKDNLSKGATF